MDTIYYTNTQQLYNNKEKEMFLMINAAAFQRFL